MNQRQHHGEHWYFHGGGDPSFHRTYEQEMGSKVVRNGGLETQAAYSIERQLTPSASHGSNEHTKQPTIATHGRSSAPLSAPAPFSLQARTSIVEMAHQGGFLHQMLSDGRVVPVGADARAHPCQAGGACACGGSCGGPKPNIPVSVRSGPGVGWGPQGAGDVPFNPALRPQTVPVVNPAPAVRCGVPMMPQFTCANFAKWPAMKATAVQAWTQFYLCQLTLVKGQLAQADFLAAQDLAAQWVEKAVPSCADPGCVKKNCPDGQEPSSDCSTCVCKDACTPPAIHGDDCSCILPPEPGGCSLPCDDKLACGPTDTVTCGKCWANPDKYACFCKKQGRCLNGSLPAKGTSDCGPNNGYPFFAPC